jgi:hypothetical protein
VSLRLIRETLQDFDGHSDRRTDNSFNGWKVHRANIVHGIIVYCSSGILCGGEGCRGRKGFKDDLLIGLLLTFPR